MSSGRIEERLAAGFTLSAEFFPPKTPEGFETLEEALQQMAPVRPDFVSVTYGAGGSTRDSTRDLVVSINQRFDFPAMPHLTCMGHQRQELVDLLDDYAQSGIANVLALAGDPPSDGSPLRGDFQFASELVELIAARHDMSIAVAAFPEGHPRSTSLAEDRRRVAEKLDVADFGITQFFFDADDYFKMCDDLASLGCSKPVLPGVMPMNNPATVRRFAEMNGVMFPEELAAKIEGAALEDRVHIIEQHFIEMCQALIAGGAPGLHVYCMNRPRPFQLAAELVGRY